MQYEPSAVEDYANLALLFDRDADPDRKDIENCGR